MNVVTVEQVWLIEVNVNPSLATNCEMLREVVPGVVKETLCKFLIISVIIVILE